MNCKPGDLAIIVHNDRKAPNVGRIVEVITLWGEYRGWPLWHVRASSPLNSVNHTTGKKGTSVEGLIPDAWLRPISGLPVDEEQHDEVPA